MPIRTNFTPENGDFPTLDVIEDKIKFVCLLLNHTFEYGESNPFSDFQYHWYFFYSIQLEPNYKSHQTNCLTEKNSKEQFRVHESVLQSSSSSKHISTPSALESHSKIVESSGTNKSHSTIVETVQIGRTIDCQTQ